MTEELREGPYFNPTLSCVGCKHLHRTEFEQNCRGIKEGWQKSINSVAHTPGWCPLIPYVFSKQMQKYVIENTSFDGDRSVYELKPNN